MIWLSRNWSQVIDLAIQHLLLSLPAILVSVLVAVPLGRLAFRRPRVGGVLLGAAGLLYAIPALPLLLIISAAAGLELRSPLVLVVALSLYGVALLVRSAADAFNSVDQTVRQAAVAQGLSRSQVLWRLDLPLALPVLMPGLRVVAVSTVSLVTIGALTGIKSLGSLLTDGFQRGIMESVVAGVAATVVLALLLDGVILLLQRWLTPWTRSRA